MAEGSGSGRWQRRRQVAAVDGDKAALVAPFRARASDFTGRGFVALCQKPGRGKRGKEKRRKRFGARSRACDCSAGVGL